MKVRSFVSSSEKNSKIIIISEILFIFLPLLIISIIRIIQNNFSLIFYNSEWSFASLIFFGQSIVKFSSGITNNKFNFRWQAVALIVSILIVFGIVPSAVLLVSILLSKENQFWLYLAQILLFLISCFVFYYVGTIGYDLLENRNGTTKT